MKLIKNFNEYISFMLEGLIVTYPIKTTIKLLNRKLGELKIRSMIDTEDATNTIFIKTYKSDLDNFKIDEILKVLSLCGYFPSTFDFYNEKDELINNIKYNENFDLNDYESEYVQITIESSFNNIVKTPQKLYHSTELSFIEKIRKNGLIPKSKNKKSYHKERIYFAYNKENAINMTYQFNNKTDYVLLEINTTNLNIILYDDPDFPNNGCYTHDNISYSNIKELKTFKNY